MANRRIAPITMSAMLPPMVMDNNLLSLPAQPPADVTVRDEGKPRPGAVRVPEALLLPRSSPRTHARAEVMPGRGKLPGPELGTA